MNSYFLELFFSSINSFFLFIIQKFRLNFFRSQSLLSILLLLFIFTIPFSLELAAQREELSHSQAVISVNQSQFNLFLISPSNILFLLILGYFLKDVHRNKKFQVQKYELVLLLFLMYTLLSGIFSINLLSSGIWIIKLIFCLGLYFVFSRLTLSRKHINFLIYGFLSVAFFQIILALIQLLYGGLVGLPFEDIKSFFPLQLQSGYFRAVGTLSHPNKLSLFMAMIIPFFVLAKFTKYISPIISYLGIVLCLLIPVLVLSRWGFVTTLFSFSLSIILICYVMKTHLKKVLRKLLLEISTLIVIFLVVALVQNSIFQRYTTLSSSDLSYSGRVALLKQSIYIIQDNPLLGVGPGNFVTYFINYDNTANNLSERFLAPVHNLYFLLASEVGIIGLLIFLVFVLNILLLTLRVIKAQSNKQNIIFYVALNISIITFLFNGLWELRQFTDRSALLFFTNLGLLSNILVNKNTSTSIPSFVTVPSLFPYVDLSRFFQKILHLRFFL
jgi:O-antigen ligase